jgi:hypothetical protein
LAWFLCDLFKGPLAKEDVEHFKPLTPEYIEYGLNDVERTWFIYTRLRDLYRQHGRTTPIWSRYSVASVGKAYYKDFGIETFLSKNMKGSDADKLETLKRAAYRWRPWLARAPNVVFDIKSEKSSTKISNRNIRRSTSSLDCRKCCSLSALKPMIMNAQYPAIGLRVARVPRKRQHSRHR